MPIVPAGSINLNAIGVPNVYVQIQPPNPLLNGVPTNVIGVVGIASYGPVNSPTPIGSLQELVQTFGPPLNATFDMGTQVYNALQQGANDFVCIRVTDGTDVSAIANLIDSNMVTGATLTAKYTGAYANSSQSATTGLQAVLSQGNTASTYNLSIYFLGGVPEVFSNIGGSGNTFWQNLVNAVNLGQSSLRGPSQLVTASTGNNIQSVTVTAAGSYATLPTLGTSGPGSGATLNPNMEAVAASVVAAGTVYAVGDTITLTGGTHSANAILTVATAQLVSLAINAAGSGYNIGDTVVLAGGTHSAAAVITVASIGGGGSISTFNITTPGSYTVEASSFTQGSTSGIGSGATFQTAVWGVNTVTVSTPGSYSALPSDPVAQGSSSGSGTGATFTVLWGLLSVSVPVQGSGYTSASQFTVTGGGGTGGAHGTLVLGGATGTPTLTTINYFANGTNGTLGVSNSTLIGSDVQPRSGMYALRGTDASIGVLADQTDGVSNWNTQATFGLSEGIYMIGTMAAGLYTSLQGSVNLKNTDLTNPSYSFKLMLGDWILIDDPFNNVQRYVSPQGFVAGILGTLDPSNSSLNKQMQGIIATQKTASKQTYSDADLLLLEVNGIDLITSPIPLAPTANVFGVRLGVNTSTNITTNGDNYTRMINFLAETFETGLGLFVGKPQTVDLQLQAKSTLQNFLQNLVTLGSIGTIDGSPAFKVVLDSSNNPPNRVALGFMQADVTVTFLSIVQQFVINLQGGQSVQVSPLPPQLVR